MSSKDILFMTMSPVSSPVLITWLVFLENPDQYMPKLNDLVEKSGKNGITPYYIAANQALFSDLFNHLCPKFELLHLLVSQSNKELETCKAELADSKERELKLLDKVQNLEKQVLDLQSCQTNQPDTTDDFYIVGSSILRDVSPHDIQNGKTKCIRGGKITDVKENIQALESSPKAIITLIGGDLESKHSSVENVSSEYNLMLTEAKSKFPDARLVVAGLPPRFPSTEVRTKVKDFNQSTKNWCEANDIKFIDLEAPFELRNGDVDKSAYITTGATPNVHLNRPGTVRLLESMQKEIPELRLNKSMPPGHGPAGAETIATRTYAQVTRQEK